MFKRLIIIAIGASFASFCVVIAFLTPFGKNPATLHLTKIFQIGYSAINACLIPFGIAGIIGGFSRKKALIRAFSTYQWWLATFIVIGLNISNIALSRNKGDVIRRCQNDLAKNQPETDFSARCTSMANDAERAAFIAACCHGGIMLLFGVLLLIVGMRECSSISLEEETKNLLEKANVNKSDDDMNKIGNLGDRLSPKTSNVSLNGNGNGNGNIDNFVLDPYDSGRYLPTNMINVKRQPSNLIQAATANANLARRPTNNNVQYSDLRRNLPDPRNQTFIPQSYKDLTRNPTIPGNVQPKTLARYPTNGPANVTNVTRQPTTVNAYSSRNYTGPPQATYPTMTPQRSLSKNQYVNPPPPSYVTQLVIPPPKPTLMNVQNIVPITEVNDYNNNNNNYDYSDDYVRKPYTKTTAPYLTRVGNNWDNI